MAKAALGTARAEPEAEAYALLATLRGVLGVGLAAAPPPSGTCTEKHAPAHLASLRPSAAN